MLGSPKTDQPAQIITQARKIILENEQDEVVISPSEFKELLKYVNDDVANILRLAQYRNKRIIT